MGILYTLEDVIEQHRGKYAVTVTVRDYRGIATEFSIVKVFDDMIDAVSMCATLCEFEMDSIVIPCLSDEEFDTVLTSTEIAYIFRGVFERQHRSIEQNRQLTFDEVVAIFCHTIEQP